MDLHQYSGVQIDHFRDASSGVRRPGIAPKPRGGRAGANLGQATSAAGLAAHHKSLALGFKMSHGIG